VAAGQVLGQQDLPRPALELLEAQPLARQAHRARLDPGDDVDRHEDVTPSHGAEHPGDGMISGVY
jgi:hypothetical protein